MIKANAIPGSFTPTKFVPLHVSTHKPTKPLPMSMAEARERGWDEIDIVFITGDAYIDHPSFATAILGRVLEANGFRVGIVAQPDWQNCRAWKTFGKPKLFFAISAGNMDSMINHYTANKKVRNDDAYSPGGKIGLRPDRATLAYCQRAREAYRGVPVIAGGVEASLRRIAHYDYWSDTVKRSILLDSKADLLVFGMGESAILEIAQRLQQNCDLLHTEPQAKLNPDLSGARGMAPVACAPGSDQSERREPQNLRDSVKSLRDMRGVAYAMGASETPPSGVEVIRLPSFEEVKENKYTFAEMTRIHHLETNPYNARTLVQMHDRQAVVCNPPRLPESQQAMDYFYDMPYTRKAHPRYEKPIPAFEVIKDSVTMMRGCFGGCTYCSITAHQGRIIQSRSKKSIVSEINRMGKSKEFKGVVSDLGGPTANMYEMKCVRPEIEAICRRLSCVHPNICPLLGTDHKPLIDVMKESRKQKGVRKVLVASGVRMDLAQLSPEYMEELTHHHVGGHLKVAPENTDSETLGLMKRPSISNFKKFADQFVKESKKAGKEQYLVPYFISAHPGNELGAMIELAVFLKQNGYRPQQVQDFIPAPMDIAACMYHTGLDPMTKKEVYVAKYLRDRKLQRALMQFFKPENYFLVRRALIQAGRQDLIGNGCDALIPSKAPPEAIEARRHSAQHENLDGDHVHSRHRMPKNTSRREDQSTTGYRPGRRGASRRQP